MNAIEPKLLYRIRTLDEGMPRHIAEDNGCDVSPSCLSCPLSVCKYEDRGPYRAWKKGLALAGRSP